MAEQTIKFFWGYDSDKDGGQSTRIGSRVEAERALQAMFPNTTFELITSALELGKRAEFRGSIILPTKLQQTMGEKSVIIEGKLYDNITQKPEYLIQLSILDNQQGKLIFGTRADALDDNGQPISESPGKKGRGWGGLILRAFAEIGDKFGRQELRFTAGDKVGGYIWAAKGGIPANDWDWDALRETITARLESYKDQGIISQTKLTELESLIGTARNDLTLITNLEEPHIQINGQDMKLGKALMWGTEWMGKVPLAHGSPGRNRFDALATKEERGK